MPRVRQISVACPRPPECEMLASGGNSTLETTTKRSFALKRENVGLLRRRGKQVDKFFANLWGVVVAVFPLAVIVMALPDYAVAPGVSSTSIAIGVFQWI